jgi:hypothetical protein
MPVVRRMPLGVRLGSNMSCKKGERVPNSCCSWTICSEEEESCAHAHEKQSNTKQDPESSCLGQQPGCQCSHKSCMASVDLKATPRTPGLLLWPPKSICPWGHSGGKNIVLLLWAAAASDVSDWWLSAPAGQAVFWSNERMTATASPSLREVCHLVNMTTVLCRMFALSSEFKLPGWKRNKNPSQLQISDALRCSLLSRVFIKVKESTATGKYQDQ